MDEGWLYGEWETGPWWAFHTKVFIKSIKLWKVLTPGQHPVDIHESSNFFYEGWSSGAIIWWLCCKSVFHLLYLFIFKTSLSVMLYNEGEGCGVLWLAGVGNRHAWTPGFYKTWTGWSFKDLKHHKPLWLDLIMFFNSWPGGTHALLQTSLKVTPSSLRTGRNILTRPGSRICKRLTRRTRRQLTW